MSDFVPYKESLILYEELGFNESCYAVYSEHDQTRVYDNDSIREGKIIPAPLYQQVFRFFRENYYMEGYIFMADCLEKTYQYHINFSDKEDKELYSFEHIPQCFVSLEYYSSYEEAELACLIKLIKIVKQQKQ